MSRYVALGSSMAAGPGIRPSAPGAPFGSGRSARNYAHLVAERLGLDLVDVTFSGATTANVLAERQRKLDGLRKWKFGVVLQTFPLVLQLLSIILLIYN